MIKSFKNKETKKIYSRQHSKLLPKELLRNADRKLAILNSAKKLDDLRIPPGNHLEALKHDRKGQYSIKINDQWRICFQWENEDVFDVEIVDYH